MPRIRRSANRRPTPPPAETPEIDIEPFQLETWRTLCGPASNVLVYGGARSGKTHLVVLWFLLRALSCPGSSQAFFRFHFNALRSSILGDAGTLAEVCKIYWPGRTIYEIDKSEWCAHVFGGSLIWFGGLEDKSRTEKILGQGHSGIYLNESSQISYKSFLLASTRLSQNSGLPLKMVVDENPPDEGHWTQRVWIKGVDPESGAKLPDPNEYDWASMHPANNPHLPESTKRRLENLRGRERTRYWDGQFGQVGPGQLWSYQGIDAQVIEEPPCAIGTILIIIDPSGCSGPEDTRSDEVGIAIVGLGEDSNVYVLGDETDRLAPDGEDGWGAKVIRLACEWEADAVCAETNFGGAMVGAVIRSASARLPDGRVVKGSSLAFREIHASRGKHVRADPVATLTTGGRVKFVGRFPELFDQLVAFYQSGYRGSRSPDRADAFIHGAYALGVVAMPGQVWLDLVRQDVEQAASAARVDKTLVQMLAPPGVQGTFFSIAGTQYGVREGRIEAKAEEVDDLLAVGFRLPAP